MTRFARALSTITFLCALLVSGRAATSTFTVNSTVDALDANPGDGVCETAKNNKICTLRAAVQEAVASREPVTIVLPAGTYALSTVQACTYNRNPGDPYFVIAFCLSNGSSDITIAGAGASTTIIDLAGTRDRAFVGAGTLSLSGITIQNGEERSQIFGIVGGGAIYTTGRLNLTDMVFTGNISRLSQGGAIRSTSTLNVNRCRFTGNGASSGGALYSSGPATITNSTFNLNTAQEVGSAIANTGGNNGTTMSISSSTISGNTGAGSALYSGSFDDLTVSNSTISGNGGNGITAVGNNTRSVRINSTTIAFNESNGLDFDFRGVLAQLSNSIVANNGKKTGREDVCFGVLSLGHNIIGNIGTCFRFTFIATDKLNVDPLLAPLANNGGLTQTHALQPGSPALSAGDPKTPGTGGAACPAADQRGILRPQNNNCSIGAFETVAALGLTGVIPARAGSGGVTVLTVSGSGFQTGATLKLRRSGQSDIGSGTVVVDLGQASLSTSVDLTGVAPGVWDVIVTNSDNTSVTLPSAFTVEQPTPARVWTQLVGPSFVRAGGSATYSAIYGNRGNLDALAVPLTISIPSNLGPTVFVQLETPPAQPGQVATDWTSAVPIYLEPGPDNGRYNLALLIPVVPAFSTGSIRFTIAFPGSLPEGAPIRITALVGEPFLNPTFSSAKIAKLVAAAQTYSQSKLGVTIPSSSVAAMNQYLTNQFQLAVSNGRNALIQGLGTQPSVYSLGQLNFDLAKYGGSTLANSKASSTIKAADSIGVRAAGGSAPAPKPCSGQVLDEGTSCTPPINCSRLNCGGGPNNPPPSCDASAGEINGGNCQPPGGCEANPAGCGNGNPVSSIDPNDKSGPIGTGTQKFVPAGTSYTYEVEFENLPTATAAAQQVLVTDQLDASTLDLSTFALGPISFGSFTLTPAAGLQRFTGALDLRPTLNVIAKVEASVSNSGLITWKFTSLDPLTQQLTTDALAGFLPPDVTPPQGRGRVQYSISPKTLTSGTTVCNKATIVFDANAPIATQNWCNTTDSLAPTSTVAALPASQTNTSFPVRWSGSDAGSGILNYTVYVSENGGPFTVFQNNTTATQATFSGVLGRTYAFYSIARDAVGNVEAVKSSAEATTTLQAAPTCAVPVNAQFSIAPGSFRLNNGTGRFQQVVTITRTAAGSLSGPFVLALSGLSSNATVYQPAGTTSCSSSGLPYVAVASITNWTQGQSVSLIIDFVDPTRTAIAWTPLLLAGTAY